MDVSLPSSCVPIFPLPGAFLFPHQVLPLHVFEPRYRQMVGDLLDGPGRLVIGTQRTRGRDANGEPDLLPVAGLGEILRHERLADGRYQILVLGLSRVRFVEVPSDRLYRQVRCAPFVEIAADDVEVADLTRRLREATSARLQQPLPLPESAPPGLLADLLLQTLGAPQAVVERAFAEPSVSRRARLVLQAAEHGTGGGEAAAGD
ncbi:MAG: LON peptidase substrate-binding domain-containing protein [Planctomycetes bacterium]|nr:LON peptidase substrate-binding domain-containing protein [Planctomycetota bacterium]